MGNGVAMHDAFGKPLGGTPPVAPTQPVRRRKPLVLITTQTGIATRVQIQICVAIMMIAAFALGTGIITGTIVKPPPAQEGGFTAVIPGYPFSGTEQPSFAAGELLVKFSTTANPQTVVEDVLADPQVVLVHTTSGGTLQTGTEEAQSILASPEKLEAFTSQEIQLTLQDIEGVFSTPTTTGLSAEGQSSDGAGLDRWKKVTVEQEGADLGALAKAFQAVDGVEYAEPNMSAHIAFAVNDPFTMTSSSWGQPYADLWGLDDIFARDAWDVVYATPGDLDHDGELSPDDVDLLTAYVFEGGDAPDPESVADVNGDGIADIQDVVALSTHLQTVSQPAVPTSDDVVVAVIDTGVDYRHAEMAGTIWANPGEIADNTLDDDGNGLIDDVMGYDFTTCERIYGHCIISKLRDADPIDGHGHGTHIAGTIAARTHNAVGIAGVCPQCTIMPVKALNNYGSGFVEDLAAAVEYAALNDADVINASWGAMSDSQVLKDAFAFAWSRGVVSVGAAGNSNIDVAVFSPANIDTVIAVGAVIPGGTKAVFSNYGAPSVYSPGVDVTAPGGDNNGKSWRQVSHVSAINGSFTASSLTGAQSRIGYTIFPVEQTYDLTMAVGPDKGIAEFSILDKGRWLSAGTFDAYRPEPGFITVAITLPGLVTPNTDGWLRVRVTGSKNSASTGTEVGIDGGFSWDEDIDDRRYIYLDSDADLTFPMSILSLRAAGTDMIGNKCCFVGNEYYRVGGTSMAAGYVSGLAGLLKTQYPGASAAEISGRINSSAQSVDGINAAFAGKLGSGRIDAARALSGYSSPALTLLALDPQAGIRKGQPANLVLSVMNKGTRANGVTATLTSSSSYVTIQDGSSALGDLDWADRKATTVDTFRITVNAAAPASVETVPVTIRLSTQGYTTEKTFHLALTAPIQQWRTAIDSLNARLAPVVANVVGDARSEILVDGAGMDGGQRGSGEVALLDSAGNILPGWPVDPDPTKKQMITSMAIGDIDGNGTREIVLADFWTRDGYQSLGVEIYAIDGTGVILPGFPIVREVQTTQTPRIALTDLDGNAGDEIAVVMNDLATVYTGDGTELPGWPKTFGYMENPSYPAVGDIDADGVADLVFFTSDHSLTGSRGHALGANGQYLPGWPITGPGRICDAQTVIADLDANGGKEVMITSCQYGNAGIFIYQANGTPSTPIRTTNYQQYMGQTPTPVDLDADGDLEIVVPSTGSNIVDAWHHTGVRVAGWPVSQGGTNDRGASAAIAADVDADGKPEILLGTRTDVEASIYAWNHDGSVLSGFPISQPFTVTRMRNGGLVVGDVDADGFTDLVVVRSADGSEASEQTQITVHEFASVFQGESNPWPAFQHDAGHTGIYAPKKCTDGTVYSSCNATRQYCDNGRLVNNCTKCGFTCPSSFTCQANGSCSSPCKKVNGRIVCLSLE